MFVGVTVQSRSLQRQFERDALPYLEELHRAALQLTRHAQDADDLVQEAFIKAYDSYAQFKTGSNCRAWLHRILRNAWFTRFQRRKVEARLLSSQRDHAVTTVDPDSMRRFSNPECALNSVTISTEVMEALEAVPEPFRTAVIMVDINGLSYKEAAEEMGVAEGTVMSRLHRGRRRLRDRLGDFAAREGYAFAGA